MDVKGGRWMDGWMDDWSCDCMGFEDGKDARDMGDL